MRRIVLPLCLLLALALVAGAHAQNQETPKRYILTLMTSTQLPMFEMPMLPDMPNMPDFGNMPDMPDLGDMPDMGQMPDMGNMPDMSALMAGFQNKPTRSITGEATYPHAAVAPIWVTVPADLKFARNQLPLEVPEATPDTPDEPDETPEKPTPRPTGKMTITDRLYWHPDEAHGPVENSSTIDFSKLPQGGPVPPDAAAVPEGVTDWMDELARTATGSESKIPEKAMGKGNYVINTGKLTIPLSGFLPALTVTSHKKMADITPAEGLELVWEPVAGARGFIVQANGMKGDMMALGGGDAQDGKPVENLTINWVSTLHQPPVRVIHGYEIETSIADDLEAGILLPPETTACKVPAGIFPEDLDLFTVTVIAVGNDFYDKTEAYVCRGLIRSQWSATKMNMPAGFGAPGDMGGDDEGGNEGDEEGDGMELPDGSEMPEGFQLPPGFQMPQGADEDE